MFCVTMAIFCDVTINSMINMYLNVIIFLKYLVEIINLSMYMICVCVLCTTCKIKRHCMDFLSET